jgi:hypothetical protein
MNSFVEMAIGVVVGFLLFAVFIVVWYGPGYWAVRDAYRRGKGSGLIILLWLVFGPLAALIWLGIRPSKTLLATSPQEFGTPDDALSAASRLEHSGEWAAAAKIYESVAQRWPEHREYVSNCLEAIRLRESVA